MFVIEKKIIEKKRMCCSSRLYDADYVEQGKSFHGRLLVVIRSFTSVVRSGLRVPGVGTIPRKGSDLSLYGISRI
jgi:hypothetical protein